MAILDTKPLLHLFHTAKEDDNSTLENGHLNKLVVADQEEARPGLSSSRYVEVDPPLPKAEVEVSEAVGTASGTSTSAPINLLALFWYHERVLHFLLWQTSLIITLEIVCANVQTLARLLRSYHDNTHGAKRLIFCFKTVSAGKGLQQEDHSNLHSRHR